MGQSSSRNNFEHVYTDEPHASRRKEILKKHPEIKTLFGPDLWIVFWVFLMVFLQLAMLFFVQNLSWGFLLILAYSIGGVLNHGLMFTMHEMAHNLVFSFKYSHLNKALGVIATLPIGVPAYNGFKYFHLLHHKYQGVQTHDSDIPTALEAKMFRSTLGKFIWVWLQPISYSFRGVITMGKPITTLDIINAVVQIAFDVSVFYFFSFKALAYLFCSSLLGMGMHPSSIHFLSEHYLYIKTHETYSYYGPLNWLTFNIGYHNEHHDFPFVACSRLPEVRKIAPEFYDNLPHHTSLLKVLYDFLTDSQINLYSRMTRDRNKVKDDQNSDISENSIYYKMSNGANNNGHTNGYTNGVTNTVSNGGSNDIDSSKHD